jgi:hypothetical protein
LPRCATASVSAPPRDRLEPVANLLLDEAGFRAMARQHFGLRLHDLRKLRFQGRGDAAMQLLAAAGQQRAVRGERH